MVAVSFQILPRNTQKNITLQDGANISHLENTRENELYTLFYLLQRAIPRAILALKCKLYVILVNVFHDSLQLTVCFTLP